MLANSKCTVAVFHVLSLLTRDIKCITITEHVFIGVYCGVVEVDFVTLFNLLTAQFHVIHRRAAEGNDRWIVAQDFLNGILE